MSRAKGFARVRGNDWDDWFTWQKKRQEEKAQQEADQMEKEKKKPSEAAFRKESESPAEERTSELAPAEGS